METGRRESPIIEKIEGWDRAWRKTSLPIKPLGLAMMSFIISKIQE